MKNASSITRTEGSRKLVLCVPTKPKEILEDWQKFFILNGPTKSNQKKSSMGKVIESNFYKAHNTLFSDKLKNCLMELQQNDYGL